MIKYRKYRVAFFDNIRFLLYFGQNERVLRQVRQATLLIIPGDGAYRYTGISYVMETNAFAVALSGNMQCSAPV